MRAKIGFILIMLLLINLFMPNVQAFDQQKIEDLLQTSSILEGAIISVSVRSAKTGEVLYEHLADTRLRPASNMKLFTAASALSVLGDHHRFTTNLYTDGTIKWKILNGNLYIRGSGDPTLLKKDIDDLVQQLKEKGVTFIKGNLVADDSRYDAQRYSVDLPWSDEEAYYGAQVSALTVAPDNNYDSGTVMVEITPGNEIGEKGIVTVTPFASPLTIRNTSTTVDMDEITNLTISREHGANHLYIKGGIPKNASSLKETIALWEPTNYVLELFNQSLKEHGITLLGESRIDRIPQTSKRVASHSSMPLSKLLIPFMKLSNNGHAETLIKEMGYIKGEDGSWEMGLQVLQDEIKKWGIESESMIIRDGSGISHVNGIQSRQMTKLLFEIQNEPWFESFLSSMPLVDGQNELERGTLHERMRLTVASGKVRAKTGTLTSVSSLAGYIEHSEDPLIFSIILNQVLDGKQAKQLEDQLVLAMLE
ncbi:D-alanyl-D-alanine carboxypeptidase/D-alanyl-D-alanine endopeptidase [Halalkalibacter alkalisediminis]|uniref:D-alanyl-D-alanine carboxypeptidase/D-alanyl-D-alanine-endopeptidase n=1 Tax=Halalkalibacter alkalisediminis TaxID=935616 RepID=A0ABV6NH11_9BACI|nr:D-alanyl-D-alanine carboxypeptidase/D-alanyl-D-alanine-endopeptidase [Halalkalibacter alkalisediminis]